MKSVGTNTSGGGRKLNDPLGIAVHPTTGQIFVADNNCIQVFDNDLTYLRTIGNEETFYHPWDVALDDKNCLYVAGTGNHCIQTVTTTGKCLTRFGSTEYHLYPSSLAVHRNLVYVSEYERHCVSVFDTKGRFLHRFGEYGFGEREFNSPYGITTDRHGNLYVSDTFNDRLVN